MGGPYLIHGYLMVFISSIATLESQSFRFFQQTVVFFEQFIIVPGHFHVPFSMNVPYAITDSSKIMNDNPLNL